MSIVVYDNFLPGTFVHHLEQYFTHQVKWKYVGLSSGMYSGKDSWKNSEDSPMLCLVSYYKNENTGKADISDNDSLIEIRPLLWFLEKETGMTVVEIDRIKSNLYLKNETWKEKHHPPHTDSGKPENMTLLYYINDSDGPTYFYDTKIDHPNPHEGNIIATINPKKGTAVLFESNRYHAGTLPTEHDNRMVINIVFSAHNYNLHEVANERNLGSSN